MGLTEIMLAAAPYIEVKYEPLADPADLPDEKLTEDEAYLLSKQDGFDMIIRVPGPYI